MALNQGDLRTFCLRLGVLLRERQLSQQRPQGTTRGRSHAPRPHLQESMPSMPLRFIIKTAVAMVLSLIAACGEETQEASKQPHIVVITAGDLAVDDLGTYGGPIPTPNMDRLAARGILFTRGYAAAAHPGPSRAALASGQYPQRFGYMYETGPVRTAMRDERGMPDTVTMVQERLRSLGYETAMFGAWNLGGRPGQYATQRGFDYFWGTLGARTTYIGPRIEGTVFAKTAQFRLPPSRSRFDTVFSGARADKVNNVKEYLTDSMGEAVVEYIARFARVNADVPASSELEADQDDTSPLFLWAAFHAPRTPLTALEEDFQGLPDLGSKQRNTYGAMVRALDRNIGRILDSLEASGMLEDTLLVFTADRGCDALAGTCPCTGLRAGAPTFREGALRVPFIVSFPGAVSAQTRVDVPVMPFDITATIMDLADPEDRLLPEFDGRSLTELLGGNLGRFKQRALYWQQNPLLAVLMNNQKMTRNGESNVAELYDLSNDPAEKNDIASINSFTVSDFETRLDTWQQANSFPLWDDIDYGAMTICGAREFGIKAPR